MKLSPDLRRLCNADTPIVALSPHIDDVMWSAGGLLQALTAEGCRITLVSIFSHTIYVYDTVSPPIQATAIRKAEDYAAVRQAGLREVIFLDFPDGVLRDRSTDQVLDSTYQTPAYLLDLVIESLKGIIPPEATVLAPVAFGGHMDHLTTRRVAERLPQSKMYYEDLPYAARDSGKTETGMFLSQGGQAHTMKLPREVLQHHMDLFWLYRSQASPEVAREIKTYLQSSGLTIWIK